MNTFCPGLRLARSLSACHDVQSDHRDRRCLHEVQIDRLERGGILGDNRKFSESTRAQVEDAGKDSITRLEASHATSDVHHDTR